jgi:excisionase family DNA binding protein
VEIDKPNIANASNSGGLKKVKSVASLISRQYYDIQDVATYFDVHPSTIRRLIGDGLLPRIKIRSSTKISIKEVKKLEKRLKVDEFA